MVEIKRATAFAFILTFADYDPNSPTQLLGGLVIVENRHWMFPALFGR